MPTPNYWRGDAPDVSDVWTLTVTGPATGPGTIIVPIGTKSVTIAYVNTETADVIAARLSAALSGTTVPEFGELDYVYPGTTGIITGTGKTAGVPVTIGAVVVTAATGVAVALAHATSATGRNWADNAANWSLAHLPTTGEDAIIAGGPSLLYGLGGMYAGVCASTRFKASFTGAFGLPVRNQSGGSDYYEYRQLYLDVSANGGEIHVGEGQGSGSPLGRIRVGDTQSVYVYQTGSSSEDGAPALDIGTTGSGNPALVAVYGGDVGFGVVVPATRSLVAASIAGGGSFTANYDVTTINQRNGSVVNRAHITTLNILNGDYTQDAGRIDNVTASGGAVRLNHDQGANTILAVFRATSEGNPPYLDATGSDRAGKILAAGSSFTGGAYCLDPYNVITKTSVRFDKRSLQASDVGDYFLVTVV